MAAPFGATTKGARNLVLSVGSGDGVPIGSSQASPRVSDDTLGTWLEEGGNRVLMRIPGYERLTPSLIDTCETSARALVHLYAAALLADATHPERVGGTGRLSDSMWTRFQSGLDELSAYVAMELDLLPGDENPVVGRTDFGAAGRFRPPTGWTCRGF